MGDGVGFRGDGDGLCADLEGRTLSRQGTRAQQEWKGRDQPADGKASLMPSRTN